MGSSYFYLEFLLAWASILREKGFQNPAVFALEYTLVPDAVFPTQYHQAIAGYDHVLSVAGDPSRICVGGDSAGGTLVLSLLLHLGSKPDLVAQRPAYATLISPWTTLVSPKNRNTKSDYLNAESLHQYGRQYAGTAMNLGDPLVSPGTCGDEEWWGRSVPTNGMMILYGSEEVFGPDIRHLATTLKANKAKAPVDLVVENGGIHAWPVVELFLGEGAKARRKGLDQIAQAMWERCGEKVLL
ncbi:MAG: hypothetical protein M1814_002458 [Vezdaea aestivalis]|nr:MAG: hypothetical protein M1814_002458 [Vezdaea aestivalis]